MTTDEKSNIYSLLSGIKEKMEYINEYYIDNFKNIIDRHVNENKKHSLCKVTDEDMRDFAIWKLEAMLENNYLYRCFIEATNEYYACIHDLKKWFIDHPLLKCKFQKYYDALDDSFKYKFAQDGIGLIDERFEAGIIHLVNNYSQMHNCIIKFIKKISKTRCERATKIDKKINKQYSITEEIFIKQLVEACFKLQDNKTYYKNPDLKDYDLENRRNRTIRTLLDNHGKYFNYTVKDQTQRGDSPNGKGPGEIDFLIEKKNVNFTIIEALNLDDDFNKTKLKEHEIKLKNNYDKVGNKFNTILVYADVSDFDSFHEKYNRYLKERYGESVVEYDTEKLNSFGYRIRIGNIFRPQYLYHLVFKFGEN